MKKHVESWSVRDLEELINLVHFPDYQREPNLWGLTEKQRLIDSMVRHFDIASLYFYRHDDDTIDCVDGRQRIGAIMDFLGHNPENKDNGFPYRILNEIEEDKTPIFQDLSGKSLAQIRGEAEAGNPDAENFIKEIYEYDLTVVNLSEGEIGGSEFNLQFTRLNLGTIINSGEKLNAMVGELRDICYETGGLGSHPFLADTGIPTRRYSREQVAAQIIAQVFAVEEKQEYARTRHYDLQNLFRENAILSSERKRTIERIRSLLDWLSEGFGGAGTLRSRAMVVSTVLLGWEWGIAGKQSAETLAEFVDELQCRLKWQMAKRLDVDPEYRYLVDFQRHVTQASVEPAAVTERARVMREEYQRWFDFETLRGDEEWAQRHDGRKPSEACRSED